MKSFEEMNYYEILEVPVNASFYEIRCAYKEMASLYNKDSISTYSLFSTRERKRILGVIDKAFDVLSSREKREKYDESLLYRGEIDSDDLREKRDAPPELIFQPVRTSAKNHILKIIKEKLENETIKKMVEDIDAQDNVVGSDLKKLREALGIELKDIYEVSRISIPVLEAIEADHFQNLPSLVYLKGFLKSYAELFKLDAKNFVHRYISNIPRQDK